MGRLVAKTPRRVLAPSPPLSGCPFSRGAPADRDLEIGIQCKPSSQGSGSPICLANSFGGPSPRDLPRSAPLRLKRRCLEPFGHCVSVAGSGYSSFISRFSQRTCATPTNPGGCADLVSFLPVSSSRSPPRVARTGAAFQKEPSSAPPRSRRSQFPMPRRKRRRSPLLCLLQQSRRLWLPGRRHR